MILKKYLSRIKETFPQLFWQDAKLISSWWTNDVIILDNSLVFRFPKEDFAIKNFQNEVKLLNSIAPYISANIPKYSHIASDFWGYNIIKWKRIRKSDICNNYYNIASFLGKFLSELHSIDINNISWIELDLHKHYTLNMDYVNYIQKQFYEIKNQIDYDLYIAAISFIEKSHPINIKHKTLTHFDLQLTNILFSQEKWMITGIIDFSEAVIYDPAIDFRYFLEYGDFFIKKVLENYKFNDDSLLERTKFFTKKHFIFWFPDLFSSSTELGKKSLLKKLYTYLNM